MIDVGGKKLFACDECPIVKQLEYRMAVSIEHPEYGEFQFDHCGCDKVEDEFFACGYCEDAWVDRPTKQKRGQRRTGRAYRRKMRIQKRNRQMDIIHHCNTMSLSSGINKNGLPASNSWGLWKFGIDDDDMQETYIKRPKSSKYKGFYKNYSNRLIRRKCVVLPKGNQFHKIFEYWWTLY